METDDVTYKFKDGTQVRRIRIQDKEIRLKDVRYILYEGKRWDTIEWLSYMENKYGNVQDWPV